jgi:hypothetical protein
MDRAMTACPWEMIDGFQSRLEFDRFADWMNEQVTNGGAVEAQVVAPYLEATAFTEKWFKHTPSGYVWRLVWPDGPFTGLFEQVDGF